MVSGFNLSPSKSKRSVSNTSKNGGGRRSISRSANRNKSRSISKTLGVGKSRRKQLRDQKDKELKEQVIKRIREERSKSKAAKRETGIYNMMPMSIRSRTKGFEPKDPTLPTKHRKNHCSPGKNAVMPLRKSTNKKWSNNFTKNA